MTSVAAASGLTDSQLFTQQHAHLGARDYIFAKLVWSEQQGAERLASGEETETFQVQFEDRIFTLAGKKLDVDLESMRLPDESKVKLVQPSDFAGAEDVQRYLLSLQEVEPVTANTAKTYDFRTMTRQEIADAGKELFAAGKITLDELFRFDHPDGKLKIGLDGNAVALNPHDKIDFIAEVEKALRNMEATGEANQSKSVYPLMQGLLEKLLMFGMVA